MKQLSAFSALLIAMQLAACASTPVASQEAAEPASASASPTEGTTVASAGGSDLQCKTVESTGSRLGKKKVCTTAAERERMAAAAKDFVDNSSRSSNVLSGQ